MKIITKRGFNPHLRKKVTEVVHNYGSYGTYVSIHTFVRRWHDYCFHLRRSKKRFNPHLRKKVTQTPQPNCQKAISCFNPHLRKKVTQDRIDFNNSRHCFNPHLRKKVTSISLSFCCSSNVSIHTFVRRWLMFLNVTIHITRVSIHTFVRRWPSRYRAKARQHIVSIHTFVRRWRDRSAAHSQQSSFNPHLRKKVTVYYIVDTEEKCVFQSTPS